MVGMLYSRPNTYLQRILRESLLALAALMPVESALAQSAPSSRVAEIATYQGADREQRLIEGAKKEKELIFYSLITPDDIAALGSAFDKKYGVKVKVWRADSENILQRIVNEAKARRFEVDIASASSSALEPLYRENLLQEVRSPALADIIPEAIAPHRQWVAVYLNTIVQAYNTNLVRKDSLPKTYQDLLRPEWKGKLGIEAEDFDWFAQVVTDLGEERGLRLFRSIVAANGISVRKGTASSPIWSPPARCRWRSRFTGSRRSRPSARARRSTGSRSRRRSRGPRPKRSRAMLRIPMRRCCSTTSCSGRVSKSSPAANSSR